MASIWHRILDALRGFPAVSPLALLLALRRPKGLPGFLANVRRSYRASAKLRAAAVLPHDLLKDRGVITMRLGEHGVFPGEAGLLVAELVAAPQPLRVFEIGTFEGAQTALIAMSTSDETRVLTLDLPPDEPVPRGVTDKTLIDLAAGQVGARFRDTSWDEAEITQLYGNSKTFDFSPYYDSIELVVIDASHSHEFVLSDSMQAFRMIRAGGVLLGHEYESMRSEYGVTRCVDRLWKRHGCPIYRLSSEGGDSRYALMYVDEPTKEKLAAIAQSQDSF